MQHVAPRIQFARSSANPPNTRIMAAALVSGIAGLGVIYPTTTFGNGTAGEWTGRFQTRSPRLTLQATSPDLSMTARFHPARAATNPINAGSVDLARALKPSGASAREALPKPDLDPVLSRSLPVHENDGAPNASFANPAPTVARQSVGPLDAVRIALPPAPTPLEAKGAMLPAKAAIGRRDLLDREPQDAAPVPAARPLTASAQPQALSITAPSDMSRAQSFQLSSAPREVREFDLARLGSAKAGASNLARSSAEALASATKATARPRTISGVAKAPDRIVGDHILHVAQLSLAGVPSGNLSVRIGMTGELSVRLADLLTPIQDLMEPAAYERLANSSTASDFVSFADLRAAGFDIRYDAGNDRLMVSTQL